MEADREAAKENMEFDEENISGDSGHIVARYQLANVPKICEF